MPEGDTIHRAARRLAAALVGRSVVRFETPRLVGSGPMIGTKIVSVEAKGKYLLVNFGDGSTLETHMKMTGGWHLYEPGESWRRSPAAVRALIETDAWIAVCFSAPHVRFRPAGGSGRAGGDATAHLGPDLCAPEVAIDQVVAAVAAARPHTEEGTPVIVADALLDQRLFCGVGNVYKSEVLHACALHPTTPLSDVTSSMVTALAETAHRLLRANLGGGPRITTDKASGLAVYGRAGERCHTCGSIIRRAKLGRHHRSTYWCAVCQPPPGVTTPDS